MDKQCLATFRPQAWINDNAVDIDGRLEFDITATIEALGREKALELKDNSTESDHLWIDYQRTHPRASDHNGPFVVQCEDAIAEFFETGVRAMYKRLAREYEARPIVPDHGGGVKGDRYPF